MIAYREAFKNLLIPLTNTIKYFEAIEDIVVQMKLRK